MRPNSHRQWPPQLRVSPAHTRLLAIVAALGALALAIGACSLTTGPTSSGDNNGFSSNTGSVTTGGGQTTPVKILRGGGGTAMVLVPITIDGQGPYNFALDTGAGITLIDTDLASNLQLPVTGDSSQVSGVGGTQNITPVHIDSWSAGKIALPTADVGETWPLILQGEFGRARAAGVGYSQSLWPYHDQLRLWRTLRLERARPAGLCAAARTVARVCEVGGCRE